MEIYHTETQADYDALMVELEGKGYVWASWRKPTESKDWVDYKEKTGVVIEKRITRAYIGKLKFDYPDIPIIKYKAKADEKMRFTKENVGKLFSDHDKYICYSINDLQDDILKLDDTPEKVAVPKFVADFYEKRKYCILSVIFDEFKESEERKVADWYRDGQSGGRHVNEIANSQETIAKMHLYGYTIEPEKLYYIPLPDLETTDGIQQVLSKRKGDKNYFASHPNENLKQRFTKEELEQVPEIYKPYAKPIEEEEE